MNTEKQRIAIAEACGWKMSTETVDHTDGYQWTETRNFWVSPTGKRDAIPDYLNDLNAMHEAEKVFEGYGVRQSYRRNLLIACDTNDLNEIISATAAQRAEAFLRTIGKWEADK